MPHSKLSNIPGLNYKSKAIIDIHNENIKAITQTENYMTSIFNILYGILDLLIVLECNFYDMNKSLDTHVLEKSFLEKSFLEKYNKTLYDFFDNINLLLNKSILFGINKIYPIKPVNKEVYEQSINMSYILPGPQFTTKLLGSIANLSIININDLIYLHIGKNRYTFTLINDDNLSINIFKSHIDSYLKKIGEIKYWIYNELEFSKKAHDMLINVISDIKIRTEIKKKDIHKIEKKINLNNKNFEEIINKFK